MCAVTSLELRRTGRGERGDGAGVGGGYSATHWLTSETENFSSIPGDGISECVVPSRLEGGTTGSISLTWSEQVRASDARNLAQSKVRVKEAPADEVGTVNGRYGSGGCERER